MKLSAFANVRQQDVQLKTYVKERRGNPYYLMIDAGSNWHISIHVRRDLTTWPQMQAHEFNSYHVTDPRGNHYQYVDARYIDCDGEGPFDLTLAHQIVSKMFGITPSMPPGDKTEKIRNYRLKKIREQKFDYLNKVFNPAVNTIGREEGFAGSEVMAFDALDTRDLDPASWYSLMDLYQSKYTQEWAIFENDFKPTNLPAQVKKRKEPEVPAGDDNVAKVPNTATEPAVPPEQVPESGSSEVDTAKKEEQGET